MKSLFNRISKKLSEIEKRKKSQEKKESEKKIPLPSLSKKSAPTEVEIKISTMTVVKILFIIAIFLVSAELIVQLKSLLITLLISSLMALGLSPFLDSLERKKIPRPVAILILYLIFLGVLTIVFVKVLPIVAQQLLGIAREIQNFVISSDFSIPYLDILGLNIEMSEFQKLLADNITNVSENIQNVAGSTIGIITGIFQGVLNFIFALVVLFFILLEREKLAHLLLLFLNEKDRVYAIKKASSIQKKMAEWFRGQFILMLIVGTAMYVGMKIFQFAFGMKYAATIGIFAGLVELFPYVGVLLSTTLASVIAINISPSALIAVLIWMLTVQFIEGNFLVPLVMEKAIGLSSTVVLIVITIGATLGYATGGFALGLLGMIFSVPIAACISIFVDDYTANRK